MRKTKIVATVGPSSNSERGLRQLIRGGVDVFRLNMSHGDHASHRKVVRSIRKIAGELDLPTAILVDLQGPKLRLGTFEGGCVELAARQRFTLTTRKVEGNRDIAAISDASFPGIVRAGDRILLDDGLLELEVLEVSPRMWPPGWFRVGSCAVAAASTCPAPPWQCPPSLARTR